MRRQVRQGESAGSAIRRCGATLSSEVSWGQVGAMGGRYLATGLVPVSAFA